MNPILFIPTARAAEQSLGLSQQIANFYQWALGIGGLVALGIIVFGGILYTVSAGNASKQDDAKQWITGALIGLLLLFGSYVILNTINPELTKLKDLKLVVNEAAEPSSPGDDSVDYSPQPSSGHPNSICQDWETCNEIYNKYCGGEDCDYPSGVLPISQTALLSSFNIPYVSGDADIRITSNLAEPLKQAGETAHKSGFTLYIESGYRSLKRQLELARAKPAGQWGSGGAVPNMVAYPGGSNHGSGRAVDIYLRGSGIGDACRTIAEIMYKAGWERYNAEYWHFEYPAGAGNPATRSTNLYNCAGA